LAVEKSTYKNLTQTCKHKEFGEEDKKDIIEVKLSSLRAVFFVKSHKGNKDYGVGVNFCGMLFYSER